MESTASTARLNVTSSLYARLLLRTCSNDLSVGMGNIIELCAAHLYPDPKINLGFTMCLTREYQAIPERSLVEDCALEHAIDIKELNDCATQDDGALGLGMLRDSVRRSKDVSFPPRNCPSRSLFRARRILTTRKSRPALPRAVPCASTTKSTASATVENGRTAPTARASTTSSSLLRSCTAPLERLVHLCP